MTSPKRNGIHEFNLHDLFQFPCKFKKFAIYVIPNYFYIFLWYALIEKTKCKNRSTLWSLIDGGGWGELIGGGGWGDWNSRLGWKILEIFQNFKLRVMKNAYF